MSARTTRSTLPKPQSNTKKRAAANVSKAINVVGVKASPYPSDFTARAYKILGGEKVFRSKYLGPMDWIHQFRKGIAFDAADSLSSNIQATNAELAQILGITVQALAWRRRKGFLANQESEKLFRVACVIARAEDVFNDPGNALSWLRTPNIVLRGSTPFSLLDTEVGGELVMQTLGRIQFGIPA